MERIGFTASEEKSFECWRRTTDERTDGRRMPAYTISLPMSLRLRWAKDSTKMSHLMRLWYFSSSVISFFKRACAAIEWGLMSDVWSDLSSTSILYVCEQRRLWRDRADVQARLSILWLPMWEVQSLATHWAHSEDSDQTGRIPRLIWVFAGRTVTLLVLSCRGSNALWSSTTNSYKIRTTPELPP